MVHGPIEGPYALLLLVRDVGARQHSRSAFPDVTPLLKQIVDIKAEVSLVRASRGLNGPCQGPLAYSETGLPELGHAA